MREEKLCFVDFAEKNFPRAQGSATTAAGSQMSCRFSRLRAGDLWRGSNLLFISSYLPMPRAIVVRQKLAHYKKNAPTWYIGFIAVTLILGLISSVAVYLAVTFASEGYLEIKLAELMRYAVIVIAGVCFHIPLNYVYFIKRKDLFVN